MLPNVALITQENCNGQKRQEQGQASAAPGSERLAAPPGGETSPTFDPITHRYCTNCNLYKLRKGFTRINNFRTICQDCNRVRLVNVRLARKALKHGYFDKK